MRKVILYIAVSLDGYIAREDGSIDWLMEFPNPDQVDHGYKDFISNIDLIVMGRATYEQVLGFDVDWPYQDKCFVVTSNEDLEIRTPQTYVLPGKDVKSKVDEWRLEEGKNIWLMGGGKLNTTFLQHGLLDEMILSLIPIVIGGGIPIFDGNTQQERFKEVDSQVFSTGIVNLYYSKEN